MSQVRLTSNGLSVLVNFLKYPKFAYTQAYEPSQIDFKWFICFVSFLKYGKFAYTQEYEPSKIGFKWVICLGEFSQIW